MRLQAPCSSLEPAATDTLNHFSIQFILYHVGYKKLRLQHKRVQPEKQGSTCLQTTQRRSTNHGGTTPGHGSALQISKAVLQPVSHLEGIIASVLQLQSDVLLLNRLSKEGLVHS